MKREKRGISNVASPRKERRDKNSLKEAEERESVRVESDATYSPREEGNVGRIELPLITTTSPAYFSSPLHHPLHKCQRCSHRVSLVVPFHASGVHPIPYQLSLFSRLPPPYQDTYHLEPFNTTSNNGELFVRLGVHPTRRIHPSLLVYERDLSRLRMGYTLPSYYFVRFYGKSRRNTEICEVSEVFTPYFFIK